MRGFIAFHIILSIVCFLVVYRKHKESAICVFIIILLIPILGFVYMVSSKLFKGSKKNSEDVLTSYQRYIKNSEFHKRTLNEIDYDKEINHVPVLEAFELNDNKIKRQMVIDILKDDYKQHIGILKKALKDEDTETSHYAAAGITEIKKDFEKQLIKTSENYKSKKDVVNTIAYLAVIKAYIESELLDNVSNKEYCDLYSLLLEELLMVYKKEGKYFIEKIDMEILCGNYEKAKMLCDEFYINHSFSEEPYIMYMKLYYKLGDNKKFNNKLQQLMKDDKVKLSKVGLELVRFWKGQ